MRNSSCLVGTGPAETTSHPAPAHDDGYLDNSHLDGQLDADADEYDYGFLKFLPKRLGIFNQFLADRTNGRAIATLLRLSSVVVCLSVTLCIVAKRCVLEQKLLLRAYRKSYMRNRLVPK